MAEFLHRSLTEEDTTALARELSKLAVAGDVILLEGQIGAGKSFLCRQFIRALLGPNEEVPSPTFTLVQTYDGPECEIWHCDLYRLTHADDVFELGLEDAFDDAVSLIEWPDRLGADIPVSALWLRFSLGDNEGERMISLSSQNEKWSRWIAEKSST
ncbi:MAG: tRNA (adenosine(37)-N6)-threonylcarbamoyltransferase complex ATPase subunit type 1 TsaE [Halocynthiibacter sp.]